MSYHTVCSYKSYAETLTRNITLQKSDNCNILLSDIGEFDAICVIIGKYKSEDITFYIKDEESIFKSVELIYSDDNIKMFSEYKNMAFDLIIMNPPYNMGNKVTSEAISHLKDDGVCSCLMPLSQYKKKELYRHIEKFELADPKLFKDATIVQNLCVCNIRRTLCNNKYYRDFILENNPMKEAYNYSISVGKHISMKPYYNIPSNKINRDLDFIDSSLIYNKSKGGGYFAKGGIGYLWNIFGDISKKKWITKLGIIHFDTKRAKDNFCKYAYNYNTDKYNCLASKLICNVRIAEASEEYYFSIPQIDWSNIHISQKELWEKGDYDNAVLAEMGLKWNDDKTKIVKA